MEIQGLIYLEEKNMWFFINNRRIKEALYLVAFV
jgi:hypothetical protein